MDEYPKYVDGIIAQNREQEDALRGNRAILKETESAEGVSKEFVGVKAEPTPKPAKAVTKAGKHRKAGK